MMRLREFTCKCDSEICGERSTPYIIRASEADPPKSRLTDMMMNPDPSPPLNPSSPARFSRLSVLNGAQICALKLPRSSVRHISPSGDRFAIKVGRWDITRRTLIDRRTYTQFGIGRALCVRVKEGERQNKKRGEFVASTDIHSVNEVYP